ncbi:MAG: serine/threonine-protein kinase [Gemmatimonadaceae bacterium]
MTPSAAHARLAVRAPEAARAEEVARSAAAPAAPRPAAGRVAGHLATTTTRAPLAPGDRVHGGSDYQVVRELGRGASGAVYLARDVALHRTVALKVLPAPHRGCAESCERFRREARMTAQLSHPNIVPLYAFGEAGDAMYIVMPYVDGGSLADRLRREPRLPAPEARRLLAELALALDHAHRRGIVHRDVKPENVLLDRESGRAMLTDFGVATRRWWDVTPAELRRAFGTPAFMSPEQALGEPNVDGRSDLYAVGVLGYAMLSGTVPFDGRDPFAVTARRLSGDAPPLRALAPDAPADLVAAIERCLAADAESRWTSARELHDALTGARPPRRPPSALTRRLRGTWTALRRGGRPPR